MLEGYPKRQPETVRLPLFTPEPNDIQNIMVSEDHKQVTLSEDKPATRHHSNKARRWRWLRHVIRKDQDSVTKTELKWTLDNGKRKRGRPRETWRTTIEADMKTTGKTRTELETTVTDREQWKSLVAALRAT